MRSRPDPKGKRVSLFVTCIVDMIYPETGMSTVEVLERLGCEVDFPAGQTCCGQMGFNAGYRADAKAVAIHFLKTFKDSEVIVTPDGLGVTDIHTALDRPVKAALHDACHGLRVLGLHQQARTLLQGVDNLELVDLAGADQCCGFGGLFAVKMPEVSGAMLNDKMKNIDESAADIIITGDASCLTQMNGGLNRTRRDTRVLHIADVLAGKILPKSK